MQIQNNINRLTNLLNRSYGSVLKRLGTTALELSQPRAICTLATPHRRANGRQTDKYLHTKQEGDPLKTATRNIIRYVSANTQGTLQKYDDFNLGYNFERKSKISIHIFRNASKILIWWSVFVESSYDSYDM